jgi:hypothetical protein
MGVFNMGVNGDLKNFKLEFLQNCSVTFFLFWHGASLFTADFVV